MDLPPALIKLQQQHKPEVIHDAHAERARRYAEGAPQRQVEATARALPDSLFASHPEVVQATHQATTARNRVERMTKTSKQAIATLITELEAEAKSAADAVQLAAIDDAIAGDSAFPLALAAMEHHSKAQQRLQAARMAHEVLSKAPMSLGAYWEQARKSEAAHNELLLRLKREHLQAHPELLQEHQPASS